MGNSNGDRAKNMRDKAIAIAMKRKEEYLGARVPKSLKDRVIAQADEMNIPVSLLIRRVLEEAFSENSESRNEWSISVTDNNDKQSVTNDKFGDIVGWKTMEVNQDRSCERCREPLPKGSEAMLGFTTSNNGYVIVCHQCKTQLINS